MSTENKKKIKRKIKKKRLVILCDEIHESDIKVLEWLRVLSDHIDNIGGISDETGEFMFDAFESLFSDVDNNTKNDDNEDEDDGGDNKGNDNDGCVCF